MKKCNNCPKVPHHGGPEMISTHSHIIKANSENKNLKIDVSNMKTNIQKWSISILLHPECVSNIIAEHTADTK